MRRLEQFQVSASSAIRWMQRFREDGVCDPARTRGRSLKGPAAEHGLQSGDVILDVDGNSVGTAADQ